MLRVARVNQKLSAHAYLFGTFDFNATPLAPPGIKVIVHTKPEQRTSWDPNGKEGWYIGPSLQHYRCMKCYISKTRAEVNADTIVFIPKKIVFPEVKPEHFLQQAAEDIVTILSQPQQYPIIPTLQLGNETKNAFLQLASILGRATKVTNDPYKHFPIATAKYQNKPDPPEEQVINHSATPSLQDTLTTLTSVMEYKIKTESNKIFRYRQSSYKTKAMNFLVESKKYNYNFNKAYHIFNHKNQQIFDGFTDDLSLFHIYDDNGKKSTLDKVLQGDQKEIWNKASSNEFGRLAQGNKYCIKYRDVMEFIHQKDVPADEKVTYASFVLDY